MDGSFPQFPQGKAPRWHAYPVPGHAFDAGQALGRDAIDGVMLSSEFVARIYPLLPPGTLLEVTDASITPVTTGKSNVRVLDVTRPETGTRDGR